MIPSMWARRSPPAEDASSCAVGRWRPTTPAELTASRRELSAALRDRALPTAAAGTVQQLLLTFEELASNALRHGHLPIEVTVTRSGSCWLVEVSDGAADRPPTPATGRDPALGGLGLPLVATICDDHGWTVRGGRKVVWASLAYT